MARKNRIIFTDNEQSDKGIMSLILSVICLAALIYSLVFSYIRQGEVPKERFGAAFIVMLIMSVTGIALGSFARMDEGKYKLIPTIGLILNLIVLVSLGFLLWIGLN